MLALRRYSQVYGSKFYPASQGRAGSVRPTRSTMMRPSVSPDVLFKQPSQPDVPSVPAVTANDDTANVPQMMTHFAKILTKHGRRGDHVLARVSMALRHKYQHPSPIQLAIDAIKPVLKYQKFKHARSYVPVVLHPKPSCSIAMRWILDLAGKRIYTGNRPSLERGLVDEIDAIINRTSTLYARRLQFHKNPN